MTAPCVIALADKLASFSDYWNPRIVAKYNDNELRLAKVQGDFTWHSHTETDELFIVLKGNLGIEFRDGTRRIAAGEMIIVPRGVDHRPFAEEEVHMLIVDREGEPNTGDTPSERTRETLESL